MGSCWPQVQSATTSGVLMAAWSGRFSQARHSGASPGAPDGKSVAVGNENGFVEVLTLEGTGLASWQQNGSPGFLAFSPDGSYLAVTSNRYLLRLLPLGDNSGQPIGIVEPSTQPVNPAWSTTRKTVAVSSYDGTIHTFDEHGSARTVMAGCSGLIEELSWSPDGRTLAVGSSNGDVCVWSCRVGMSRPSVYSAPQSMLEESSQFEIQQLPFAPLHGCLEGLSLPCERNKTLTQPATTETMVGGQHPLVEA